jgi:pimeloyl-ACP methyl ester carboxylesterase
VLMTAIAERVGFRAPRGASAPHSAEGEGTVDEFRWEGHRLVYEVHGHGPQVFVFLHGLLLDTSLNRGIAGALASRGHRVILLDLLGHGRSDRPTHAYEHRMELWAEQTVALLDHLGLEEAVVGGVSLGANVTLHVAGIAPERLRGMVVEMPVLERGTMVGATLFLPMVASLRYLSWLWGPLRRLAARMPDVGHPIDSFAHLLAAGPREVGAVIHGLYAGSVTPLARARRRMETPALVIGHRLDALHPMDDARALVDELPQADFVEASSILEARLSPARIVAEMDRFLERAWADATG